jgi:PAS domain S-box-containing protein
MYGHTSAEMVGRNIDTIVPPDRWLEHSRNIAKLQGGEGVSDYETVRLTKDGSRLDVSVSVSPIRDAKGRTIAAASIARDVTARKRVEQQLERLTQRLLTLQDSERRRLARELHDVTAQNLFAMSISLSRLQQPRMHQSEDALLVLAECGKLCEQALQEIRTLSYVPHPPMLDLTGLPGALRWYVAGFTKRSGINVEMLSKDEIGRLPTDIETALFRVVQECLSNIRRHSGSNQATIRLERLGDRVVLQIRDYGRGMPDSIAVETDGNESLGVGIPGMRQRLHQLGGVLDIESTERGMVVTATVPISAEVLNDPNLNGDLEEKQKETG